jgi:hypothetical protein
MDDMAGWTCVTSLFMGHENMCKPQMTVMTPWQVRAGERGHYGHCKYHL